MWFLCLCVSELLSAVVEPLYAGLPAWRPACRDGRRSLYTRILHHLAVFSSTCPELARCTETGKQTGRLGLWHGWSYGGQAGAAYTQITPAAGHGGGAKGVVWITSSLVRQFSLPPSLFPVRTDKKNSGCPFHIKHHSLSQHYSIINIMNITIIISHLSSLISIYYNQILNLFIGWFNLIYIEFYWWSIESIWLNQLNWYIQCYHIIW